MTTLPASFWWAAAIFAVNVIGYLTMIWDKFCARRGMWRVPEERMLTMAFMGGALGCKAAQFAVRHKTRKQPFARQLNWALGFNILVAVFAVYRLL
ncbi:DUF1294 domain-containing protein [Primorskyibacter sp. S187A]|uniref:DUF1294 domain-containing protein n=1 Tax=Primorskyibacter sp. S187A TaxID=3415130 RepID=UPI003C7D2B1B